MLDSPDLTMKGRRKRIETLQERLRNLNVLVSRGSEDSRVLAERAALRWAIPILEAYVEELSTGLE